MCQKLSAGFLFCFCLIQSVLAQNVQALDYPIVDTGVKKFYSASHEIAPLHAGDAFFGQDASYAHRPASYTLNGDGTTTDNVTGLMWQYDMGAKMTLEQAQDKARALRLGGHNDWRVPTVKELYSLIDFNGRVLGSNALNPFIDTRYFHQPLGDASSGERQIDAQTWSSTVYRGNTMGKGETIFGVNFVDGRIKGYPKISPRTRAPNAMYFRMVRGNPAYGVNRFVDNHDGTVSDLATGLMWQQADSLQGLDWQAALRYSQDLRLADYDDWRLPSVKELQSIVDYSRSPQATGSAAIDPVFAISRITDPRGMSDYPFYWSATTHLDGPHPGQHAAYVIFGTGLGKMHGRLMDVHGAGAQRSDPKSGNGGSYPSYFGPQGDVRYVYNHVRSVRSIQ